MPKTDRALLKESYLEIIKGRLRSNAYTEDSVVWRKAMKGLERLTIDELSCLSSILRAMINS